jgi:error-prone DNA polymerase
MTGPEPSYVELQVTTHFSFLRGASSPDELFAAAAIAARSRSRIASRGRRRMESAI